LEREEKESSVSFQRKDQQQEEKTHDDSENDRSQKQQLQKPKGTVEEADLLLLLALLSRRDGDPAAADVGFEKRDDGFDEGDETGEEENLGVAR
jgi:hypothetical protein